MRKAAGGVAVAYPGAAANLASCGRRPVLLGMLVCALIYVARHFLSSGTGNLPSNSVKYGCMLDAGSSGSRIHVYKFNTLDDGSLRLLDETFVQVKPGLSAFAETPEKAAESLQPLIEVAREKIPAQHWADAPIALYATAGLRLIDPEASKAILHFVERLLSSTPFKFQSDFLKIMDGKSEGLFGWTTVNFLLHKLDPPSVPEPVPSHATVGIMDLGGASTQIVYEPADRNSLTESKPEDVAEQALTGGECVPAARCASGSKGIFVHSFLGLGLNEAVNAIEKSLIKPESFDVKDCRPHPGGSSAGAAACQQLISSTLFASHEIKTVKRPPMDGVAFYAFSYFYDKAEEANLTVDTDITVAEYHSAADRVCNEPAETVPTDREKLCLQMAFLSALLEDGYNFDPGTPLTIAKHIDGYETSWTLGAMISLLS